MVEIYRRFGRTGCRVFSNIDTFHLTSRRETQKKVIFAHAVLRNISEERNESICVGARLYW